jgi:hypothetical protein
MTPYALTISGDEQGKVYRALKAALFCAEQQASIQVIGAQQIVGQIKNALEIMNRPSKAAMRASTSATRLSWLTSPPTAPRMVATRERIMSKLSHSNPNLDDVLHSANEHKTLGKTFPERSCPRCGEED